MFMRDPHLATDVEIGDQFGSSDHNMISFQIQHSSPVTNSLRGFVIIIEVIMTVLEAV